jgi:hypothetical protein
MLSGWIKDKSSHTENNMRKIGTILSMKHGNRVEVIDYTDRTNSKEIGAFYLCPIILSGSSSALDQHITEKVYEVVVDKLGEGIEYTLDAEDF